MLAGHVQFGFDANNTLWASAGGPQSGAAGWINVKLLEETGDEAKSQGWTPFILDTNGNGKRDEYTEPNQPLDPAKDRRINVAFYGVSPSRDGTVWGTSLGYPGYVVRLDPTKPNPSETALAEVYEVPAPAYGPRGMKLPERRAVDVRSQRTSCPRAALQTGCAGISVRGNRQQRSCHRQA